MTVTAERQPRETTPPAEIVSFEAAFLEHWPRVYATLGDDKCSVDALTQQPVAVPGDAPAAGDYWVNARGFCMEPAATLDGSERVLISRFDFRGRIHLEESDLRVTAPDR